MKTVMFNLSEHLYQLFCLGLSAVFAFITALLRSGGFTSKNLRVRCTDALLCSMLSTGLSEGLVLYFGIDYEYAMPIGIFVGFMGSDVIKSLLVYAIDFVKGKFKNAS